MRYGVPGASMDTVVAMERANAALEPESSHPHKFVTKASSSPQVAFQILNRSLSEMNSAFLQRSSQLQHRATRLQDYSNYAKESSMSSLSYLDNSLEDEFRLLGLQVKNTIDQHNKAVAEMKRRKEKQEEERRAKERLEAEREENQRREQMERDRRVQEKKAALKKKDEAKAKALKDAAARSANSFTSKGEMERLVLKYQKDIKDIKDTVVAQMDMNKDLKKSVGVIKRKINARLGQLSNSMQQLERISNDIIGLVHSVSSQLLAYQWLLNFLSKAIISQAETEVPAKLSAALPIGRLAAILLLRIKGLDYYLIARFVKKCCLTIGYTGSIDTEEGRIRMGWKRQDGKWETEVKYEERVAAIFAVWAVVGTRLDSPGLPFFGMRAQWTILARILNTPTDLLMDVHYVAICNWWEATAAQFSAVFGKQAFKLLTVIGQKWTAFGKQSGFPAATRLQVLAEDLGHGEFNSLKEMEQ